VLISLHVSQCWQCFEYEIAYINKQQAQKYNTVKFLTFQWIQWLWQRQKWKYLMAGLGVSSDTARWSSASSEKAQEMRRRNDLLSSETNFLYFLGLTDAVWPPKCYWQSQSHILQLKQNNVKNMGRMLIPLCTSLPHRRCRPMKSMNY
jgi:hypothetical protein